MADTYTLADLMEEQRTLGGRPALPDVRPREMRTPALGQSNLVDRALSSFGQPSLDALRRGYAGDATPQEIARTFLETGSIGPFGAVRTPPRTTWYHGTSDPNLRSFSDDVVGGARNTGGRGAVSLTPFRTEAEQVYGPHVLRVPNPVSPEIIEILRKYGIIAPPVGAAAASTLAGEPQP